MIRYALKVNTTLEHSHGRRVGPTKTALKFTVLHSSCVQLTVRVLKLLFNIYPNIHNNIYILSIYNFFFCASYAVLIFTSLQKYYRGA